MTPQYTAETRLEISREEPNITSVEGLETQQAGQDDEFYQTQYSNLVARSLAERIVRALRLASNDAFFVAHGVEAGNDESVATESLTAGRSDRERRENLAVDLLLDHVDVAPIPRSRSVDSRYTSASPDIAATVADQWAEEYIAANSDRRFASTSDAREFLEGRLTELGERLEESERRAVNYAAANDIVALGNSITPDGRTLVDRTLTSSDLEALNAALTEATADRIAAESRARARGANTASVNNQTLATLRQRRAEASADYARLMTQFLPGYPQAVAVQSQIDELDAAIAREEARISESRTNEYREAAAREADLRAQVSGLKSDLTTQQAASIQYNIFRREADTNRQLYDSLLQRYKEIGVAGVAVNNITIIDTAEVPTFPSSPNLLLNLAIALVGGMGVAFLMVIALEQIDEGLRDPGSVRKLLGIPLLGTVPSVGDEDILDSMSDRKSSFSEAYFSIQSSLSFATEEGFPKSLMLTSTRAAEGKTTSSVALAKALARTSRSVLLVDADLRSPSCHTILGLPNEADWRSLIHDTDQPSLSFMSTGPIPPSAAELFSGDRFAELLQTAGDRFQHIIVDASPVLGLADAPLLARKVEGSVFVIETNGVSTRALRTSVDRLRQANGRVFGAIMTKYESDMAGYGSEYGYTYGYGQQTA